MRWMHITWHLPSDAVPVVAFSLLLINSLWLILYFVLILSLSKPCPPGHSHTAESLAIVWGLLAFLVANVLTSLLLIILGCCGTPFTPSKRWLVPYVLYFDFFKYVAAIGFVTWGLVVTIDASSRDEPCWAPTKHKNIEILLWCTISVFVLVL